MRSLRWIQVGYISASVLALAGLAGVIGGVLTTGLPVLGLGLVGLGLALALSCLLDLLSDRAARRARAVIEAEQARLLAELDAGMSRAQPSGHFFGIPVVTSPLVPEGRVYLVGEAEGKRFARTIITGPEFPDRTEEG